MTQFLFLGGRRESLSIVAGTPIEVTTTGRFDSAYADAAFRLNTNDVAEHLLYDATANILSPTSVVSGQTIFLHFEFGHNYGSTARASINLVELRDSSGFPWLAIRGAGAARSYRLVQNSGSGASPIWTPIGADFSLPEGLYEIDIELSLGSPHSVNLYIGRSLSRSGTFTQAAFTDVAAVRYASPADSGTATNNTHISQIMVTRGVSTVGGKVRYSRATGAGASNGWSNTFAAVNEVVGSDAALQSATSAGLKSTHAMGDVAVPTGMEIRSVFHWLRAKNDGTAPNNIRSVLRQSGVDYSTGNLSGIGLGYGPVGARYDTDPLGLNWTQASWNAVEAGYESAT